MKLRQSRAYITNPLGSHLPLAGCSVRKPSVIASCRMQ